MIKASGGWLPLVLSDCERWDNLTDLWTVQSVANEKGRGSTVIMRYRP
jgi:hypothetical protein